jgi:hypothetical protein
MKSNNQLHKEPEWLYPFMGMGVGDSFFIPTMKSAEIIYSAMEAGKEYGIRVKAYASMKDGIMGVRVWRVN